ncbi:MAG: S1C family serine protease [Crocinitomicaceae bacterium]|jgi:S1-C subfamily serine protease
MTHFLRFSSVALLLFTTSCTAIFIPKKQKINFSTDNDSSVVSIDGDNIGEGKSFEYKVRKSGLQQVVVKTPGYKDEHLMLRPYRRSPAFYPLAVLDLPFMVLGYGQILINLETSLDYPKDISLNNQIHYDQRENTQRYIKVNAIKVDIKDQTKDIKVYYVNDQEDIDQKLYEEIELRKKNDEEARLKEQERLDKLKKKKKNQVASASLNEKKDGKSIFTDDTRFSEDLFNILLETGYVDTVNRIFQDDNNTMVVQAKIKKVDEFIIYGGTNNYRKLGLGISWYLLNMYDEIIDSTEIYNFSDPFVTRGYSTPDYVEMVGDAIARSFHELRKTELFNRNIGIQTDFTSKETPMVLVKPKSIVKELSDASLASVIIKRKDGGHGSGFAITQDGYILTNYHVISGELESKQAEFKVLLANGLSLDAKIVRFNRARDIALLKVEYNFEKAFLLTSEKTFKNLSEVYTIGAPKSVELGQSVSIGLISNERNTNNNNVLQLSMSLNGGNSGGPLFDKTGVLHGVIQAKLVGKDTEGVGFAIPGYLIPEYLKISY